MRRHWWLAFPRHDCGGPAPGQYERPLVSVLPRPRLAGLVKTTTWMVDIRSAMIEAADCRYSAVGVLEIAVSEYYAKLLVWSRYFFLYAGRHAARRRRRPSRCRLNRALAVHFQFIKC
jgi:hypothetical protein